MKRWVKNPYLWIVVGYIASVFFLPKGIGYLFYALGMHTGEHTYRTFADFLANETTVKGYISFAMQVIRFGLVLFLVYRTTWFTSRKPHIKFKDGWIGVLCLVIKMLLSGIVVAICVAIGVEANSSTANQENVDAFVHQFKVLGFLYVVLFAPIIEEFVFRHVMLGHLFKNHTRIGLFVSTILFGGLHLIAGFSISGLVIYMVFGYLFGYIYLKTKRIESTIVIHMINNLVSILLMCLI